MPFLGKQPADANHNVLLDAITTSATATYNLTKDSTAYVPGSAQSLMVSLNGVTQAPIAAYTVSGSTIVFASALTSNDVIDYIIAFTGPKLQADIDAGTVGTSALIDDAVTTAKIADDAVTAAKIADAVQLGAYTGWSVKTGTYTAASKDQLIANSGSAFTITLPASPSAGDTVVIKNVGAGTVTIGRNSSNIEGSAQDGTLAATKAMQVVYVDGTLGWKEI
ncbi:MAG: hypothetical protein CMA64_04440 [Euryarchaeota archaeon]|nr:hypothetical protein [Euryarchaeota archaeon]